MGNKDRLENKIIASEVYRDNLKETLKNEPDRSMRKEILAQEKMKNDYTIANFFHLDKKFFGKMDKSIQDICAKSHSFNELIQSISEKKDLLIRNGNNGIDHVENIIKRLKAAKELHYPDLIPDEGGLREKAVSLMVNEGIKVDPDSMNKRYKELIGKDFSGLNFNQEELKRITIKLPPDVFMSVDPKMEKVILLGNSLEGVKTNFSCSGHFENQHAKNESLSESFKPYLSLETNNQELIRELQALKNLDGNNLVVAVWISDSNPEMRRVNMIQNLSQPPQSWILENHKKTEKEIFEESRKSLEQFFGTKISANSESELVTEAEKLQKEFLKNNPSKAILPLASGSVFLLEVVNLFPFHIKKKEYKEYFSKNMAEVIKKRDNFISSVESLLQKQREKNHKKEEIEAKTSQAFHQSVNMQ